MTDAIYLRQKRILTDLDKLIARVERGEVSPDQAEAERVRLGLGPLATRPDPSQFDPMQEGFWSLPMIYAYLQWRSADPVREMWDKYRAEVWEWQNSVGVRGFVLRPRAPAMFADVDYASSERPLVSAVQARECLWRHAQHGKIKISGVSTEGGRLKLIESHELAELEPRDVHGRAVLRFISRPDDGYDRVSASTKDVKSLADTGTSAPRPAHTTKAGPKFKFNYIALRNEAFRLFPSHSSPNPNGILAITHQGKLIEALQSFYTEAHPDEGEPSRPTLQDRLKEWFEEWVRSMASN